VRDVLGHANITTTSCYLRSTPLRLERALAAMDAGFTHYLHTAGKSTDQPSASGEANDEGKLREESRLSESDPGGDRTRDPLIKSQMLYH
jgi:hypothetical protein